MYKVHGFNLYSRAILRGLLTIVSLVILSCSESPQRALGTLEWDRVNSRAIASEVIVEVRGVEGSKVEKGDILLQLDSGLQASLVESLKAKVIEAEWILKQREAGYRTQEVAAAEARLNAAESNVSTDKAELERQQELLDRKLTSVRQLDQARNAYKKSLSEANAARETLDELRSGYRSEEVEQARAALASIKAQYRYEEGRLQRYTVSASRSGMLDNIPFKLGDKPPVGAVLSTILAGDKPWGRVYFPEPWLAKVKVGDAVDVFADGRDKPMRGSIRHIESQASFTPYYALAEQDRSRLSFLTYIDLDPGQASDLPVGIPIQVALHNE